MIAICRMGMQKFFFELFETYFKNQLAIRHKHISYLSTPTSLKNKKLLEHINLALYNKQSINPDFHFLGQFALEFKSKPEGLCVGLRHTHYAISTCRYYHYSP